MTTTTLEEKELKARTERAEKTPFRIKLLEENYFPFANYEVIGETNIRYLVEIRSLKEKINSCSCPDFQVNTLKTCKHIGGVLKFLKKKGKRKLTHFAHAGFERVEIFLDPVDSKVRLCWPESGENLQALHTLLDPYLSSNQTLLSDPLISVTSIINALKNTPECMQSNVRLSPFLMEWLNERQLTQRMENDKELFLADVEAGKRSMQMLSSPLFPYQEEGMLHLAFKGRAMLADEMGLGKTIQSIAACELLRRSNRVQRVLVVSPLLH